MKITTVKFLIITYFLFLSLAATAQDSIVINVNDQPLNEVLIDLSNDYNFNISFNDKLLSKIIINTSCSFNNIYNALNYLLANSKLDFELEDDVWVIFPKPTPIAPKHIFSGSVSDVITNEPLPYAHITTNGISYSSNIAGNFTVTEQTSDTVLDINVSYLGYYILDTTILLTKNNELGLIPSSIGLTEIVITDKIVEKSTQFGYRPGLIKINHKIAHYLPGYGDNSVFNLIRLMPGILASGEQTSNLVIWGSYAGQCKVDFDGYTVYGLRNFNDNISSFNPLLAKDIEIYKGGYNAKYGGRVGGIVNIVGKNGNTTKPSFTFIINNMTINGMADIPITKNSSLIFAFRHTYYNLYNRSELTAMAQSTNNSSSPSTEFTINPSYLFRDANVKYSASFKNNDLFFISIHGADDLFSYNIDEPVDDKEIKKDASEENYQVGAGMYYDHNWGDGNISNIKIGYSSLATQLSDITNWHFPQHNTTEYKKSENDQNHLEEVSISLNNTLNYNNHHNISCGVEFTNNRVQLDEYSFEVQTSYSDKSGKMINTYLQDRIWTGSPLMVTLGVRISYSFIMNKLFTEPRISTTYQLNENWKINSSFGIYNQFIALSTFYDDFGNYKYFWTICDNLDIPVQNATHFILGTSYNKNDFTFNIEGYHKNITGLTRFVYFPNSDIKDIFYGTATSIGVDLLVKKDYRKHSAWIAYSLSRTLENFEYTNLDDPRRAPQDQLHEIKVAAMLNFNPFFFSTNYVYGSGFPFDNNTTTNYSDDYSYSRLDVSAIYKFLDKKLKGEAGISVLNVLNKKNLKYTSFEEIPASQTTGINILTEAMPITPTIYIKVML